MPNVNDVVKFGDSIGRVCVDKGAGFWCVRFEEDDCLLVHQKDLTPATGNPPECGNCKNC